MNLRDFNQLLAEKTGQSYLSCDKFVTSFVDLLKECIEHNHSVKIKNFGVFEPRVSPAKNHFGQYSKESKVIPKTKRVRFRASKKFIKILNEAE